MVRGSGSGLALGYLASAQVGATSLGKGPYLALACGSVAMSMVS
jgi:hypothetical protein